MHPVYDIASWRERYPLSEREGSVGRAWMDAEAVFSPSSIAINEQIREEIWPNLNAEQHIPCDVFTWAWGEPPDPWVTKIGGLPYMDAIASEPWPVDDENTLMAFVGQINFEDSVDLVGDLPGDILLFFSKVWATERETYLAYESDPRTYAFRWVSRRDVVRPVARGPDTCLDLQPLHGVIHRTFDVPSLDYWSLRLDGDSQARSRVEYQKAFPPAIWHAAKIGGHPSWEQGVDLGMTPASGRFLCQLISDSAHQGPDSYHGRSQSPPARRQQLCLGDVGSVYLFWVEDDIYFVSQS